jgi:DNA-binding CsgD family transcriptional regulator/tetratricopeptide (TPR) repeat protein
MIPRFLGGRGFVVSIRRLRSPVLVGREHELELLLEAALHPPAVAVVEGEGGVGKTRLVEELLARPELADRDRYVGHCEPLAEPYPLGPVVEALRTAAPDPRRLTPVAGALRALLPELSDRLPAAPVPLGDRRAERHRLFRAVRELLGAIGPAILVLEDLHWADVRTLELVRFLARGLPGQVVVICTDRPEDCPDRSPPLRASTELGVVRIALRPLELPAVRALAERILDTDQMSDEFSGYLSARSGGLPFALEEVLGLLRDRHDLVHRSGVWLRRELAQIEVPPALSESILERLARLNAPAQRALRAAAVLAVPCDEEVLAAVAGLPEEQAADALTEALGSGLLVELGDGRYGFRHVLARDAIEAGTPAPQRRRMHLRAARTLEAVEPKPLVRLAHHFRAAGTTTQWVRYAEAVADGAESLEDDAVAYRLLKDAVDVEGLAPAARGRLAVKLATCARACLAHREGVGLVRAFADDPSLPRGVRGELRVWLGWLLFEAGDSSAAYAEQERALDDLEGNPALAAKAMSSMARPWMADGAVADHLHWLNRARRMARRSRDRSVRVSVAIDRAAALTAVGDPEWRQAVEELPAPGADPREMEDRLKACNNVADAAITVGHNRIAHELLDEARELAVRIEPSRMSIAVTCTGLQLDWVVGAWEGLRERAGCLAREMEDWPEPRAHAETIVGLAALAQGDVREARRLLEPLAADFPGALPVLSWVATGVARIRLAGGSAEAAVRAACSGLEPIARKDAWMWATDVVPAAVEALLAADRETEARELTNRFARGLRGRDAPGACAALAVCRGRLAEARGQGERAARIYLAAERAWRRQPRPHEAARAREAAGRCLLATGADRGRTLLVEAMDEFRGLGAAWDTARVRGTLREHGAIPPNRRGRKGYGDELSPREAEVVRLAGEGLTNREIAVQLYVAVRTVEQHLTSATRKLGVSSKRELRALLSREAGRIR